MSATISNIYAVSPTEWKPGYCWLCGEVTLLKFRDVTSGGCVGACCLEDMLYADRELFRAAGSGIRKPMVGDSIPNN